jgi:hypothetical protein
MYHFHFNKGTVYLPNKKSENLPVIISCYGQGESHWLKRVEENLRNLTISKHNMGFVVFHKGEYAQMLDWVKGKPFADAERIGFFTFGDPVDKTGVAFSVVTVVNRVVGLDTKIPTLFLQGTSDKVALEPLKLSEGDMARQSNGDTKSAGIVFKGSDDFLFNVHAQAAGEIIKWIKTVI